MKKLTDIQMESRIEKIIDWHGFSRNKSARLIKREHLACGEIPLRLRNIYYNEDDNSYMISPTVFSNQLELF